MAQDGLAFRREDGMGASGVNAALACVLGLTDDIVVMFGDDGLVTLANDSARRAFAGESGELVGTPVTKLFPADLQATPLAGGVRAALGAADGAPGSPSSVAFAPPFPLDGSAVTLSGAAADGGVVSLTVRCERISAASRTYVLVAREAGGPAASEREHERLVSDLSRANRRLSGTLDIVLATLDAQDVTVLFSRVMEEITQTMEATGTLFYVADANGYRLRGTSSSLSGARVPRYMPYGRTIERLTTQVGHALRLRVLPPGADELRQGHLEWRDVVDEETSEVYRVRASMLPPLTSFIAVPVWFGDHVIALIEVGWAQATPTRHEDSELLDAVAQYLSVQLVGAVSAFRARREQALSEVATDIAQTLSAAEDAGEGDVAAALGRVAGELGCTLVSARIDDEKSTLLVDDPAVGSEGAVVEVGLDSCALPGEVSVMAVEQGPVGEALAEAGLPAMGVVVDARAGGRAGEIAHAVPGDGRLTFLLLRPADSEPVDEIECAFVRRVVRSVLDARLGGARRRQDKHIAQALQTGMRNELQRVRGITAAGIYSSATQEATVGGDFYDLIRLPDERACVIMGDVSGKGVEAASVSAAVKCALGAYAWQGLAPSEMVRLLNEFLLGFSRLETFATLFVGVIDLRAATIRYCSAGHPPAVLVRARTGELNSLGVQSGVVGAFHDMAYRDGTASLSPGDALLLYTDGTTEARAADGSFFGEDGLRDAVMREWPRGFDGILERLLGTLDAFTGRRLEDDVAMVCVRYDGLAADEGSPAELRA